MWPVINPRNFWMAKCDKTWHFHLEYGGSRLVRKFAAHLPKGTTWHPRSQFTKVLLLEVSSCLFIAAEVSAYLFLVSKISTWSKVQWLDFTSNRGKLPQKCTKTWKMCTVVTELRPSLPKVCAFSRRQRVAGGWCLPRPASFHSVQ
jgi:hypothetical protein